MRKGFDSLAAVVRDWLGGDRVKLLWWDKDGLVQYGRGRVPDKIERKEEIHDLTEAEMAALGGAENLVELPPERSEQLDWRPSTLFVVVHVRKKYARKVPLPESRHHS